MILAQISDTHVRPEGALAYRRVDTSAFLARAVAHLLALDPRPDVVVATGDLVDAGTPDEYRRLRHLLAPLPMPVYLSPGNHDDRDALRATFPDHHYVPATGFLQWVVEDYALRLIFLDTLVPGSAGGRLCDERLAWLEARLAESSRPTVIVMHHPPFATGIARMDQLGLENADRMETIVRRHPNVERVLCGHVHRAIQTRWAGTIASIAPSTAHQVALDLREDSPLAFAMEPPGFQLHLWRDGALVTHTAHVGEFVTYGPRS